MAYRFGPFLYDPVSRELLRDGDEVALTPKARDLLLAFLHNPGRLLTREDLVGLAWKDVAVTDDAVRFQIAKLREALGAEGESYIHTVQRGGYRWEAKIRAEAHRPIRLAVPEDDHQPPKARYRLVLEFREVHLLEGANVVGRDPDAALWIDHVSVSRRHAQIVVAGGKAKLEDLGSKNGTFLNGAALARPAALSDGDEIRIGIETMIFRAMSALESTRTGSP